MVTHPLSPYRVSSWINPIGDGLLLSPTPKKVVVVLLYGGWSLHLKTGEVRDSRPTDQVGDGLARVLDWPHQLFQVLGTVTKGRTVIWKRGIRNFNSYEISLGFCCLSVLMYYFLAQQSWVRILRVYIFCFVFWAFATSFFPRKQGRAEDSSRFLRANRGRYGHYCCSRCLISKTIGWIGNLEVRRLVTNLIERVHEPLQAGQKQTNSALLEEKIAESKGRSHRGPILCHFTFLF